MEKPVIVFGAKGIGKVALEIFSRNDVIVYCFLDEDKAMHGKEIGDVPIIGSYEDSIVTDIGKKCEAFIAVDDNELRKTLVSELKRRNEVMPVNALHPDIIMAKNVSLGHGNLINVGVVLGTNSKIGSHCILHAGAIVDFDAFVGNYVQVGTGSVINSGVKVGDDVFIGSGVTVVSGANIGKGARIGAGSVVIKEVKAGATVFGNPAAEIKNA